MSTAKMAPEEGVFEVAGDEPLWIWAFTCPTPECPCRDAIVLATRAGREALTARGAPVREAWLGGKNYAAAGARLSDVTAFALDIDEGIALTLDARTPIDLDGHPEVRAVVDRLDGEALDGLGRLWCRGKGWPDPEDAHRQASTFRIEGWRPGDLVSWGDMFVGVRQDVYPIGELRFEAEDLYCVAQGCTCGEALIHFTPLHPPNTPPPGAVRVNKSGGAVLEPAHAQHRERLEQLWAAFQRRHPRYVDRLGRRAAVMQDVAPRVVSATRSETEKRAPKVGRNEPCPCGSGKKYKKCCGAT